MKRVPAIQFGLLSIAIALVMVGLLIKAHQPRGAERSPARLSGDDAIQHLKQDGAYESLRDAVTASLYKIEPAQDEGYSAGNKAQDLRVRFTTDGVSINPRRASASQQVTMRLASIGYGDNLFDLVMDEAKAEGNRLVIHHSFSATHPLDPFRPSIQEWYVNRPEGLEQGFSLSTPPEGGPGGRLLRIALEVNGELQPEMNVEAGAIEFRSADGESVLRYSGLFAFDATGRHLSSQMKLEAGRAYLEVDDAGALYPLTIDPNWTQQQKLTAADGAPDDVLGWAVAISGDTVIVGAPGDDIGANSGQGSAYVFVRNSTTWTQQAKLTSSDGSTDDFFGGSVAIDGNTVVIGAEFDQVGANGGQGSAYVFTRSGATWSQQAHLVANDGAEGDFFGHAVAIDGNTAVIGAGNDTVGGADDRGSAYVFTRSGTIWSQQAHIFAGDGAAGDSFGDAVAISGNTAIIGAHRDDIGANNIQGSAYVFTRSGTNWSQLQKLTALDGAAQDEFGFSVAIDLDTILVGAFIDDVGAGANQGSVYVFERLASTFVIEAKLTASDGAAGDAFGGSVGISGDIAIIGASGDDIGANTNQGSAYVFARNGINWTQQQKVTSSDGAPSDSFGFSVAINDHHFVIGAAIDSIGANQTQGSAYIFVESSPPPLVVTNTNDSGGGSLRQAITTANSISGHDLITFNIPGGGVKTIIPLSALPTITDLVTLDGTTQPGYSNAPLIEITGDSVFASGLTITAGDSTIKALIINRFVFNGIILSTNGNNVVEKCYIGTDATGTIDRGNIGNGISISSPGNLIGGSSSAARNIISGNNVDGITISGAGSAANSIRNNYIGTAVSGGAALGNGNAGIDVGAGVTFTAIFNNLVSGNNIGINIDGSNTSVFRNDLGLTSGGAALGNANNILITGSNNSIGTTSGSDRNIIAFAAGTGVSVSGGSANAILFNSIHSNGALGVDLGEDGVTANDAGDADTGANSLLNYPVITSATSNGVTATINATLSTTPQTVLTIDFYWSAAADSSGFGEGQNYFGSRQVLTEDSGNTTFTAFFSPAIIPAGSVITALTRDASGNTSEYARAAVAGDASACATLEISPASASYGDPGGSGLVSVIKATGCEWTAVSNVSWVSITSGNAGAGNGTVTYNVASNPSPGVPRTGTMTIGGQTFTLFQSHGPTGITLASFIGTAFDNGVLLEWRTGFEVDSLGFNIYRDHAGNREPVNRQLIAGSALRVGSGINLESGQSYAWWDKDIEDCGLRIADCQNQNTAYWLEDLDLNGQSTWHGPFFLTQSSGRFDERQFKQAELLASVGPNPHSFDSAGAQVQAFASLPPISPASLQPQSAIASHLAVKLAVVREGWYRVSQPQLLHAGLPASLDPRLLRLFVDGVEQSLLVSGESDGLFDPADYVEFYGTGLDTPSSDSRVYWLLAGQQPGKRLLISKSHSKPVPVSSFTYSVQRKDRFIYFSSLLNGDDDNFFGAVVASQPVHHSLTLRAIDNNAADALLEVSLQGVTDLPHFPDHNLTVLINGIPAGSISFDGRQRTLQRLAISHSSLLEGTNTVTLIAEAGPTDVSLVDFIRLTYSRFFTAEEGFLRLSVAPAATTQTISGFTSPDLRVFDVTQTDSPVELVGSIDKATTGYSVSIDLPNTESRTLLAMTTDRIQTPLSISPNKPCSLRIPANAADLLIITHRDLIESLEPLAVHRRTQGLGVSLIDIEDIYDEFSFGHKSPQAIKDFLAYTTANWKTKPRYVLFAADATYDPRNYLGFGGADLVPAKLIDTQFMETASDDWFADFNLDGLPELAIGRLPARTPVEAALMVARLIHYDHSKPSQEALLVADRNDAFNFEAASLSLIPLLTPSLRPSQIFRGRVDDATAHSLLIESLNRGHKVVNYTGHGSIDLWRGGLLTSSDARALSNYDRLSLFVMMNCLNGYFHDVAADSLAESLLKAGSGGAVAVWASSGMTLPDSQALMNQEFYRLLFSPRSIGLRIGDAVLKAKASINDPDVRRTWILLGDPTTKLK